MRYKVMLELSVRAEDAARIRDAVSSDRANLQVVAVHQPEAAAGRAVEGLTLVVAVIDFPTEAAAITWRDRVVSRWASGPLRNAIFAGARIGIHACNHDEPNPTPCTNTWVVK